MVPGSFRLSADNNWKFFIPWEPGTTAQVSFYVDNSLADDTPPDPNTHPKATPPQNFRVAIMDESGGSQHIEGVTVGRKATDNGTLPAYININTPKTACGVSLSPGPNGPADQQVSFVLHNRIVYTHKQG